MLRKNKLNWTIGMTLIEYRTTKTQLVVEFLLICERCTRGWITVIL